MRQKKINLRNISASALRLRFYFFACSFILASNSLLSPLRSLHAAPVDLLAGNILLEKLVGEPQKDPVIYRVAWFLNGLKEFDEGMVQKRVGFSESAGAHFQQANIAFQNAFDLALPADKPLAALCLKFQIQSFLELDTEASLQKGLALVGFLLNEHRHDLFTQLKQPDEIFFFQGVLAGKISLFDKSENKNFLTVAEKAFRHLIESYPKSSYYGDAIESLGKLYYLHGDWKKAKEIFESALEYPFMADKRPEYLLLLSNISEQLGEKERQWQHYRRRLWEAYPDSPLAVEAYFRSYRYSDYVNGRLPAIEHLADLPRRYPDSHYALNALYLLGFNAINDSQRFREGCEMLRKVEPLFEELSLRGAIPKDKLNYYMEIRCRAILDLASAELSAHQPTTVENALRQIARELEGTLSPVYEEAMFLLIKNDLIQHRNEKARDLCIQMIQRYQNASIAEGRYLAKIFAEYGKIALRLDGPKTAVEYFKMADKAGAGGLLTTDERLDLWIEQALGYQAMGNLEEAMLTLSQVVNYNAISSRRLKAMYYRATIYEAQGRRELAKNQLETVAKTQGKWAEKAKNHLKENYVY